MPNVHGSAQVNLVTGYFFFQKRPLCSPGVGSLYGLANTAAQGGPAGGSMAYIVKACIVMAYIIMAYIVMAYIVMVEGVPRP